MRFLGCVLISALFVATPSVAKDKRNDMRVGVEQTMPGVVMGTYNLTAVQFEMDLFSVTRYDITIGFSFRKEGWRSGDGWGFGAHAWRAWRKERRIAIIGEAGARWFAPPVAYSRFEFSQRDGTVIRQQWDRPVHTVSLPIFPDGSDTRLAGTLAPTIGAFAQYRYKRFTFRAGVRLTYVRYAQGVGHIGPGGNLHEVRDSRYWRTVLAPVVMIGF